MNTNNTEVLEAEEIPLEQVIDNSLVKHNVTDMVIASLKEKYGGMKLKDIEDKESYIDIKEARKEVRKVGILTEKICKHGREDAIKIQKMWLNKEKEILGKIAEVEDPLNAEIGRFENEVERKELEAQKKREEVYINRQSALSKMGAIYDNGSFVLNHISYEVELIKQADEDMWNDTILLKYKKVYGEIEAAKVEEENNRKAELEQQKKEREEFEAKQKEFAKQQELFAQQQSDLQKQKDDADRKERLAQEQKDLEERNKKGQIIEDRINQLRGLGMDFNRISNAYTFEDISVDPAIDIYFLNDEEWTALIEKITPVIAQRKEESAKRIADAAEKQKKADIQKALEDEENKKREAELKRLQELDIAGDKEKYYDVVKYLKNTPAHAMKSTIYKGKMNIIADFISDL